MEEMKTVIEGVYQSDQGGEAVLCNCLEVQPSTCKVFGRQVWINEWGLVFLL